MNCGFGTTSSRSAMDITTTTTASNDAKTPQQTLDDQQYAQEGTILVHVLSAVLDRLCVANVSVAQTDPGQVTKFHAMKAPGIGILKYLERIHKYASCSNECFVLALIYIDRLIQRNNFLLTELNVHRVVITAILLAAKFFDDAYYNNAYYAKVGGVLVSEMNGLEVDFLFRINFSLHVTPEVFEKYRAQLLSQASAANIPLSALQQFIAPAQSTSSQDVLSQLTPPPTSPTASSGNYAMCNPQAPHAGYATNTIEQHPTSGETSYFPPPHPPQHPCEQQITPPPTAHPMYVNGAQTPNEALAYPVQFSEGGDFAQVQRAHSYPAATDPFHTHSSRCATDSSYSAPAIITPAVHYPPPMEHHSHHHHQIFPLQNVLVHVNHANTSNPYAIRPKADPRGQMLTGGVL